MRSYLLHERPCGPQGGRMCRSAFLSPSGRRKWFRFSRRRLLWLADFDEEWLVVGDEPLFLMSVMSFWKPLEICWRRKRRPERKIGVQTRAGGPEQYPRGSRLMLQSQSPE
jgi:hypothetical protein